MALAAPTLAGLAPPEETTPSRVKPQLEIADTLGADTLAPNRLIVRCRIAVIRSSRSRRDGRAIRRGHSRLAYPETDTTTAETATGELATSLITGEIQIYGRKAG